MVIVWFVPETPFLPTQSVEDYFSLLFSFLIFGYQTRDGIVTNYLSSAIYVPFNELRQIREWVIWRLKP